MIVLIDRVHSPGEIENIFFAIDSETVEIDKGECPLQHMHMSMPILTYVHACNAGTLKATFLADDGDSVEVILAGKNADL